MKPRLRKRIRIDFVSSFVLGKKNGKKRINFILDKVKDGSILVLDCVLRPEEEMELIRETMRRVDDGFPGIEVCSLKKRSKGFEQFLEKLVDGREKISSFILSSLTRKPAKKSLKLGLTLVGPARIIKKIKKNPESFSVLAEV